MPERCRGSPARFRVVSCFYRRLKPEEKARLGLIHPSRQRMRAHLINLWDEFRESFWFLPIIMSMVAALLAISINFIDSAYSDEIERNFSWLTTNPSSARSVLSAISSAMITLVGVIFSITMVAVSMATSQYGSRLLRCFMTDSLAGYVIGTFVGTGLFCLITLRLVRDAGSTTAFTPHLSTACAIAMGLLSIALLIFFLHDVASSIQATKIVEALADDLNDSIDRLYPEILDEGENGRELSAVGSTASDKGNSFAVPSGSEGYLVGVDFEALTRIAADANCVLKFRCRPGRFIVANDQIASVSSDEQFDADERPKLIDRIRLAIVIGARRTPRQDVVCSIQEIVDVAIRALSPGVNDPFTAMNCVDRLGGALAKLTRRKIPNLHFYDESDRLRVTGVPVTSSDAIHDGFRQIRQYGSSSVAVSLRMMESLTTIAKNARRHEDFVAIDQEAQALRSAFLANDPQQVDRDDFESRCANLKEVLFK